MVEKEPLIPKHGGYRNLKSFQVAQLVYDVTVRFCDCYVEKRSRTHDQMVQAARSGVQNIAEGSQAAGTSKKTELKLTNWRGPAWKSFAWITRIFCGSAACRLGSEKILGERA
jgi:23S rRNA-intervening sequence protein